MSRPDISRDIWLRSMVILACLVIVMMGIRLASSTIVVMLLALFLAIVLEPVIVLLSRLWLPRLAAIALLSAGLLIALLLTLMQIIGSLPELTQMSIQMRNVLAEHLTTGLEPLTRLGLTLTSDELMALVDPGQLLRMATRTVGRISDILSAVLVVFLMVVFMLIEVPALTAKSQRLLHHSPAGLAAIRYGLSSVTRYLALKTLISLLIGLTVWGTLLVLTIKFAFIWGVLAFLLNFIPVVGSVIAAIPPLVQTFVFNGIGAGVLVLLAFVLINLILGCLLDPYLIGRKLDLSTSTVVISLLVWGGLLGITGVLLAVPLTLSVKLTLEHISGGEKLAILLGSKA
ncbi:AI-2E family transporter [Acerihabitans sp. TG2]|uniref:AI-2E family transporter n=1 Tax=Acerihabitans sp. TG2 TaxID=3096008 RepID=UPI002B22C1B9|nr:AI-2E family transporter [Acerihabitans sp. TG2]MEA9391597.1 AI-2E family transporter [Acerihabitans sp. TG2]